MRKVLFMLLFGSDSLAMKAFVLLKTRRAAYKTQDLIVKKRNELTSHTSALSTHKTTYFEKKQELDKDLMLDGIE